MNQFEFFENGKLSDLREDVNSWITTHGVDINTWEFSQSPITGNYFLAVYYSEANPGNQIGFNNQIHKDEENFSNPNYSGPF